MLLLETADNAVTAAAVLAETLPSGLPSAAVKLYTVLCAAAVETVREKGYSERTAHLTLFFPLEILASVCGFSRITAWRHLKPLKELGFLDYRPWKSTLRGETRNAGTLFCVRLGANGSRARLSFADFKFKWRDLDKDVRQRRTAYRQLRDGLKQSSKTPITQLRLLRLLDWTLPKKPSNKTPLTDCFKGVEQNKLLSLLDAKHAAKGARAAAVDLAADALNQALADKSRKYYCRLVYGLLRRWDLTGDDYTFDLLREAQRAASEFAEGFARNPAALLISRLKNYAWYDEIMRS
jgi:hypothetical protein